MIRATAVILLFFTACTVPSLDELGGCDVDLDDVDAIAGNGTTCRAVSLTISYSGFRPDCVLVKARDTGNDRQFSSEVPGRGERTGGSLVVAVLPPKDWGTTVEVEARAFEKSCEGEPVVSRSTPVELEPDGLVTASLQLIATDQDQDGYVAVLSGGSDCRDTDASIHPGAAESCNDVDDNCNGQSDTVELRLGEGCTEGSSCEGSRRCGGNGTVVCNVPNSTLAYPDVDRDNRGDRNATTTTFCTGVPAGFVTGPNDDCDDTRGNVFPGATERCDGLDNNCNGQADETFPLLGTACTDPTTLCAGQTQCNAGGDDVVCRVSQSVPTWYLDEDADGFGRDNSSQQACARPTGAFVTQGGDCDDGNPFTYPGARELCDTFDNDCDNQPEPAAACPRGSPIWSERTEGSSSQRWYAVSTWTPGGVWVVGDNNRRAVLTPGGTAFTVTAATTGGCGDVSNTDWYSVWADPTTGRATFGSSNGRLAQQETSSTTCTQVRYTDLAVFGLVGLRTAGTLSFYGASDSPTASDGAAFVWDGSGPVTFNATSNPISPVYGIHGNSRDTIFAVGGYITTPSPRIYRLDPSNSQWLTENVQSTPGISRLISVWVANEKLAFAAGNSGSVLQWNGTTWSRIAFPNTHNITSIVAFGASSAYATCESGHVYRYDGQSWQVIHSLSGTQFNGIAGTSPEDLWVVGNNGKILHWPW